MQIYQNCLIERDLMLQSDGSLYVGQIRNQKLQGYGLILYPDESYYYGCFQDSQPILEGQYKLRNSLLKIEWESQKITNLENKDFLENVVDFKNNTYGNKLVIKKCNNKYCYGVQNNRKFDGFCVFHYKNGDIYYGSMSKGKLNGEGIIYKCDAQSWQLKRFINGRVSSTSISGKNMVPREQIVNLFSKLYKSKQIHKIPPLSDVQRTILNYLLVSEYQSTAPSDKFRQTMQSETLLDLHDINTTSKDNNDNNNKNNEEYNEDGLEIESNEKELQVYNNKNEIYEAMGRLSHQETKLALSRVRQERLKSVCQNTSQYSPIRLSPIRIIYKRSSTPILTTIRPLFSVIRL